VFANLWFDWKPGAIPRRTFGCACSGKFTTTKNVVNHLLDRGMAPRTRSLVRRGEYNEFPILGLCDEDYWRTRASERRADEFFNILRTAFRLALHESWRDFMWYATGYDGEPPE
jgi:hypothetical protein